MTHTNSFPDALTNDNYQWIEKEFLKYADHVNYEGIYEFSEDRGLQLQWGKYDYSVPAEEQEPDMQILLKAIFKFNREFIGRYVAFGDMEDKYNCVYILDMKQISLSRTYMEEMNTHKEYKAYKTALELIAKFSSIKNEKP